MNELDECRAELAQARQMISELAKENANARKLAADVWDECEARADILDDIQAAAGGSWWYHAKYVLEGNAKTIAELHRTVNRYGARVERAERDLVTLRELLAKHRAFHGSVACPGVPECAVCLAEETAAAAPIPALPF